MRMVAPALTSTSIPVFVCVEMATSKQHVVKVIEIKYISACSELTLN